jgi:hypothetical protein
MLTFTMRPPVTGIEVDRTQHPSSAKTGQKFGVRGATNGSVQHHPRCRTKYSIIRSSPATQVDCQIKATGNEGVSSFVLPVNPDRSNIIQHMSSLASEDPGSVDRAGLERTDEQPRLLV